MADKNLPDGPVGINLWTQPRGAGKTSKMELIRSIANETGAKYLDISMLNISDLKLVLRAAKAHKTISIAPQGRLKKPYLEALSTILPSAKSLEKLPVASLKALVGAFSNAEQPN